MALTPIKVATRMHAVTMMCMLEMVLPNDRKMIEHQVRTPPSPKLKIMMLWQLPIQLSDAQDGCCGLRNASSTIQYAKTDNEIKIAPMTSAITTPFLHLF